MYGTEICSPWIEVYDNQKKYYRKGRIKDIVHTLCIDGQQTDSNKCIEHSTQNAAQDRSARYDGKIKEPAQQRNPILPPIPCRDKVGSDCKSGQQAGKHFYPK